MLRCTNASDIEEVPIPSSVSFMAALSQRDVDSRGILFILYINGVTH